MEKVIQKGIIIRLKENPRYSAIPRILHGGVAIAQGEPENGRVNVRPIPGMEIQINVKDIETVLEPDEE